MPIKEIKQPYQIASQLFSEKIISNCQTPVTHGKLHFDFDFRET